MVNDAVFVVFVCADLWYVDAWVLFHILQGVKVWLVNVVILPMLLVDGIYTSLCGQKASLYWQLLKSGQAFKQNKILAINVL